MAEGARLESVLRFITYAGSIPALSAIDLFYVMTKIYGIKNCDTMKKAFAWLDDHDVAYDFHDYKKEGVDKAVLEQAIKKYRWDNVLNRRGTPWRQLSDEVKNNKDEAGAVKVAIEKLGWKVTDDPLALSISTLLTYHIDMAAERFVVAKRKKKL